MNETQVLLFDYETRFLPQFADSSLPGGLTLFDLASGRAPLPVSVSGPVAKEQEYVITPANKNVDISDR